ncbi:hypothetical protein FRB99_009034 [Tulasnella sp. 403]|nr:hypothetical protein FRB99_009034 [Tulasnella sp. 403]
MQKRQNRRPRSSANTKGKGSRLPGRTRKNPSDQDEARVVTDGAELPPATGQPLVGGASTNDTIHSAPEDDPSTYIFFWKPSQEHGWASQWHFEPFEGPSRVNGEEPLTEEEPAMVTFHTAENFIMYHKAVLFGDFDMATNILACTDPNEVRSLGREVQNFDDGVWKAKRCAIAVEGNMAKFHSSAETRQRLLETGDKIIVEASPRDRIWGVGFGSKRALEMRNKWGTNLLGKALMDVRAALRREALELASASTSKDINNI